MKHDGCPSSRVGVFPIEHHHSEGGNGGLGVISQSNQAKHSGVGFVICRVSKYPFSQSGPSEPIRRKAVERRLPCRGFVAKPPEQKGNCICAKCAHGLVCAFTAANVEYEWIFLNTA